VAAAEPPPPDVQTPRTAGVEHCVATPVHQAAATGAPEPNDLSAAERAAPSPAPSVSAEAAPQTSTGRVEEFLGFRLDNEEYCVWIRSIKEIIRPSEITPIPRSPADILGLISLRGTIVPIFNIRRRLGLPAGDVGPKSRIVVVVLDAGPVGMVVDHVTEVISIDPDALEPPPPTMGEREASLVTATVRFQERIVGVLHLDRLVAIDTEAPLQAVA
jgi:purine-binding chemotaxis protein CheW